MIAMAVSLPIQDALWWRDKLEYRPLRPTVQPVAQQMIIAVYGREARIAARQGSRLRREHFRPGFGWP